VASSRLIRDFSKALTKKHEELLFEKYGLGFKVTEEMMEDEGPLLPLFSTTILSSMPMATCSCISILPRSGEPRYGYSGIKEMEERLHKLERKLGGGIRMMLFEVFVVDTKKLVLLKQDFCFGEDQADAMSDVSLTDEMKALKKRQRIAILAREIGEFEPFAVVHVEKEEEDS
jgi:hypothetical protein